MPAMASALIRYAFDGLVAGLGCASAVGSLGPHLQLAERHIAIDLGLLGESEHPLADDVALHLVGPPGDTRSGGTHDGAGQRCGTAVTRLPGDGRRPDNLGSEV